jgi:acyl-CoA thioesterase FadM
MELVALSRLRTTWIQIIGHGLATPHEMPDFLENFIGSMKPHRLKANGVLTPKSPPTVHKSLGKIIHLFSEGPSLGPLLSADIFKTSLEDSNLVGNIYFVNYALWQGRVRDQFFHSLEPRFYRDTGEEGELRCTMARIQHLQEAMPFDHVQVNMHLRAVHECGLVLQFEYFRVTPRDRRIKLASSWHEAIWLLPLPNGKTISAPLPHEFRDALLALIPTCQKIVQKKQGDRQQSLLSETTT